MWTVPGLILTMWSAMAKEMVESYWEALLTGNDRSRQ